jgi:hypothetical protein
MRVVPEARVAGFEPTLAKAAIAEAPGCGRASVYKQKHARANRKRDLGHRNG